MTFIGHESFAMPLQRTRRRVSLSLAFLGESRS